MGQSPVKEKFSKFYQILSKKSDEMISMIKERDSYKKVYLILFDLNQVMLESGDNLEFIKFLLFTGKIL